MGTTHTNDEQTNTPIVPWASARGGAWPLWIFTHDTANAFFTKQSFLWKQPYSPNLCNSLPTNVKI